MKNTFSVWVGTASEEKAEISSMQLWKTWVTQHFNLACYFAGPCRAKLSKTRKNKETHQTQYFARLCSFCCFSQIYARPSIRKYNELDTLVRLGISMSGQRRKYHQTAPKQCQLDTLPCKNTINSILCSVEPHYAWLSPWNIVDKTTKKHNNFDTLARTSLNMFGYGRQHYHTCAKAWLNVQKHKELDTLLGWASICSTQASETLINLALCLSELLASQSMSYFAMPRLRKSSNCKVVVGWAFENTILPHSSVLWNLRIR